jgi:hypothetical protein
LRRLADITPRRCRGFPCKRMRTRSPRAHVLVRTLRGVTGGHSGWVTPSKTCFEKVERFRDGRCRDGRLVACVCVTSRRAVGQSGVEHDDPSHASVQIPRDNLQPWDYLLVLTAVLRGSRYDEATKSRPLESARTSYFEREGSHRGVGTLRHRDNRGSLPSSDSSLDADRPRLQSYLSPGTTITTITISSILV